MVYDYRDVVKSDVEEYIRDNYDVEELKELKELGRDEAYNELDYKMWDADSVTGNGSGSYTFSRALAKEYVLGDIETCAEACYSSQVDMAMKIIGNAWEDIDVITRCFVLYNALNEYLDTLFEEN